MLVSPRPRSQSLESIVSSPLSQLTNLGDIPVVIPPYSGITKSAPCTRRHERYYFSDGNVIFLVRITKIFHFVSFCPSPPMSMAPPGRRCPLQRPSVLLPTRFV